MKKIYRIITSVIIITLIFSGFAIAETKSNIAITINNENVEFNENLGYPFIDSNRTLVPFRVTLEKFGATVSWDNENRIATAEKYGVKVEVPIGENHIIRDGEKIEIDSAAQIKDGRTFLPIRAVLEAFGCTVGWNGESNTVTVEIDNRINFVDKNLENLIRAKIGKQVGPIYPEDVNKIALLNVPYQNVKSIEGIQYLTGLLELLLNNNFIEDLTPIKSLENLQVIDFQYNLVSDMSPVDELANKLGALTYYAYGNPLNDTFSVDEKAEKIWLRYFDERLSEDYRNRAVDMAKTMNELYPDNSKMYLIVGIEYFINEKYNEAIYYFEEVINNDNDNISKEMALGVAAECYYYLGELDKAESYAEEVIKMNITEEFVNAAKEFLKEIRSN